jgi:hypothetical protein
MTATASVMHFSRGFAGVFPMDGGPAVAGDAEAGPQDATLSEGQTPIDGSPSDDGPDAADGAMDTTADVAPETQSDGGNPADGGSTFVTGTINGQGGTTVTIAVDEIASVADDAGGCSGQEVTGHQEVSIPGSALPYIYRFHFGSTSTPPCNVRTYKVQVVDSYDADGDVATTGTNTCAGTSGSTVVCGVTLDAPSSEAGASDTSDASPPDASDSGTDAGDLYSEPITFSGTVTGNLAPGASFLMVDLVYTLHEYAVPAGMTTLSCGTPTVQSYDARKMVDPTLPATYSITVGGGTPFCSASYKLTAYPVNALGEQLPGSTTGSTQCGMVGACPIPFGTAGCGGPTITSPSVSCDVSLP